MNFSKALALVAVSGIAAGLAGCGGGAAATDGAAAPTTEKQGCKGEGHSCAPGKCGGNKPAEGAAPAAPAEGAAPAAPAPAAAPASPK